MFTSMTARVAANTYCLARTRRFNRRSENSVGCVAYEREARTDTVQLVLWRRCFALVICLQNKATSYIHLY